MALIPIHYKTANHIDTHTCMLGRRHCMFMHGHGHGMTFTMRITLRTSRLAGSSNYNLARPGRFGVRFSQGRGRVSRFVALCHGYGFYPSFNSTLGGWDGLMPPLGIFANSNHCMYHLKLK